MSIEMKNSKLLKESFTTRGDIPPRELEENKYLCLKFKLEDMEQELQNITKENNNSLFKIINTRRKKKNIKEKISKLNNQLTVLKVKEEHKIAQVEVLADKVQKASEIFQEKQMDNVMKERNDNYKKIELMNLKKNVIRSKTQKEKNVEKSKKLNKLKKRMIKCEVKSKNNELKKLKILKEMQLQNKNKYKNIKVKGIKKALKFQKIFTTEKTKYCGTKPSSKNG